MIKTLIYTADGHTIAVLLRGDHEANENKIRRAAKVQKLALADAEAILKVTGRRWVLPGRWLCGKRSPSTPIATSSTWLMQWPAPMRSTLT